MKKQEIRKMIEEASSDRSVQDKLIELMCEIMETLEMKDPQEMKRIEKKMYDNGMKSNGGSGIDKEYSEYIVNEIYERNHMNKNDRLFTYQKAEQLAKQHKIPLNDFTLEDWYITLVMAESDFKELLGTNMDNYVTYAKLWLMDKDAPNGGSCKLYDYLCYVSQIIDEDKRQEYDNGYGYMRGRYDNGGMYNYPYMNRMRQQNGYNQQNNRNMMYDNNDMYDNGGMYDNDSRMRNEYDDRQSRGYYNQNSRYGRGNRGY